MQPADEAAFEGHEHHEKLNNWLSNLLLEQGPDIFRSKGILSVKDEERRSSMPGVKSAVDRLLPVWRSEIDDFVTDAERHPGFGGRS